MNRPPCPPPGPKSGGGGGRPPCPPGSKAYDEGHDTHTKVATGSLFETLRCNINYLSLFYHIITECQTPIILLFTISVLQANKTTKIYT